MKIRNVETGTFPSVFHANGMSKKVGSRNYGSWPKIHDDALRIDDKRKLRNDLTIVTWKGGKYANKVLPLDASLKRFGVEVVVLPFDSTGNFWFDSKSKQSETLYAIESKVINTKYMMALDASDVVFIKHPNDVLDDFVLKFPGASSLWCTEANDWPHMNLPKYKHHPTLDKLVVETSQRDRELAVTHGSRFAHVNAGCVVGVTEQLHEFFGECTITYGDMPTCDQAITKIVQHQHRDKHLADYQCDVFQCLYDVSLTCLEFIDE